MMFFVDLLWSGILRFGRLKMEENSEKKNRETFDYHPRWVSLFIAWEEKNGATWMARGTAILGVSK